MWYNWLGGICIMQKILIVEDDKKLRDELKIFLNNNGYNAYVL